MKPEIIAEILEALMVISFGFSWPMSIIKAWRARTAKSTSLWFLCLIDFGYVCGMAWKIIGATAFAEPKPLTYVFVFYVLNFIMVSTGIVIYFRNRSLDKKREAGLIK